MSVFGKAIKRRRKIRKNKKGFRWATADDERFFRHGFMRSMSFNGCAITMETYCHGQSQCFQDNLDGCAVAQEHSVANSRKRCHTMVPPDVAEACCASRSASTAAEKKKCKKEERTLTRKWRAEMILRRGSKAKAILNMDKLECEGVATVDRDQWKTEWRSTARRNMKMGAEQFLMPWQWLMF